MYSKFPNAVLVSLLTIAVYEVANALPIRMEPHAGNPDTESDIKYGMLFSTNQIYSEHYFDMHSKKKY